MMSRLLTLLVSLILAGTAHAATLTWDRNTEADMQDYQVYACFTAGCVVQKSPAQLQPNPVAQTVAGVKPSFVIDLTGKEGALAITARDTALNESGLSIAVPFDRLAPGTVALLPQLDTILEQLGVLADSTERIEALVAKPKSHCDVTFPDVDTVTLVCSGCRALDTTGRLLTRSIKCLH